MYLQNPHRHMFGVKAYKQVTHADRDIEFIRLKSQITAYINDRYWSDRSNACVLGSMSCEMLAEELIIEFNLVKCEVNEDNENGAIVEVSP